MSCQLIFNAKLKVGSLQRAVGNFCQLHIANCQVENILEAGEWIILEWEEPPGLRGCEIFRIVNGKIKLQRGYWDRLAFNKEHNLT